MESVATFVQFKQQVLQGKVVHCAAGEVFPYLFASPELDRVVEEAREHPKTRIARGTRGDRLEQTLEEAEAGFKALPLREAVRAPVHLSLFELGPLREEGGALAEVIAQVYLPLVALWGERGLSWQKVYPILFLSGQGCSTNYHWDPSSVLIVQLYGRKRFHSLKDPLRWCPDAVADQGQPAMVRPEGLTDEDILTCELGPGDAVWSPCRAPHWVDAYDETAFTLSIAFTDIAPEPNPQVEMLVL
ncbi:MAG: cupin domain-containing protein [Candidatus Latescibacterota bacterium]|nr:cupin domain-containing protein [Candidatus Latescibacterota bacterium]